VAQGKELLVGTSPSTRTLREHPDLDQLSREALDLLSAFLAGDPAATAEVTTHYHGADSSTFALHDAQFVLARAYGFESWPKLKTHADGVTLRRLCDDVTRKDLAQAQALLKIRPELAKLSLPDGATALHCAVFARSPEMVRLLLEHGADPNRGIWPHRDATAPFIMAKERGYDDIAQVILEEERRRSTQSFAHDPNAWPAELIAVARAGDEDGMIAFLDKHPEYINVPYYFMAPIHNAAVRLWPRFLSWLLDHGADPNLRDRIGPSPLELVGYRDPRSPVAKEMVATLLSGGAMMTARAAVSHGDAGWIRARDAEGQLETDFPVYRGHHRGLLGIAIHSRRKDTLELLLDLDLYPDEPFWDAEAKEHRRGGPLALCAETGQTEMAEALLARGATLTPSIAVWLGKSEWLRAQHAAGKLDNPLNSEGGLLTLAIKHRHREIIELLLDLGFDPNERLRVGGAEDPMYSWGAPLRACVKQGDLDLAKLLLDRGADPNGQNSYYGSPVYMAYCEKNQPMIELLQSCGGYLNAAEAGYAGQTEIVRKMLAGELDPHFEEAQYGGKTTLEQLVATGANSGTPEIVRMALERIDWPRGDGRRYWPLSNTLPPNERWPDDVRDRYYACFRLILDRSGPNLCAGHQGQTILHEVIARDFGNGPGDGVVMATMLLDAGARTDIRDHLLKSTPLGWACRWGRTEIAKLLLERGADPVEPDAEPWATPRAWAEKNQRADVLALLQERQRATQRL
jgi:ankyrin repeat protein